MTRIYGQVHEALKRASGFSLVLDGWSSYNSRYELISVVAVASCPHPTPFLLHAVNVEASQTGEFIGKLILSSVALRR